MNRPTPLAADLLIVAEVVGVFRCLLHNRTIHIEDAVTGMALKTRAQQRAEKRRAMVKAIVVRGEPVHVVRRVFNVADSTIFDWLSLYRAGGWDALKRAHIPLLLAADQLHLASGGYASVALSQ
mgnify:CR=1 FL=1